MPTGAMGLFPTALTAADGGRRRRETLLADEVTDAIFYFLFPWSLGLFGSNRCDSAPPPPSSLLLTSTANGQRRKMVPADECEEEDGIIAACDRGKFSQMSVSLTPPGRWHHPAGSSWGIRFSLLTNRSMDGGSWTPFHGFDPFLPHLEVTWTQLKIRNTEQSKVYPALSARQRLSRWARPGCTPRGSWRG